MDVIFNNVWLLLFAFSEASKLDFKVNATFLRCKSKSEPITEEEESISKLLHTVENCHRKIRVTVTVYNTEKTPDGEEYILVEDVHDPETDSRLQLLNPITVKLRQEQILLAYPFHYLTAVNGNASEVVVNYENLKNFTGCDDTSPVHSTCGVKHQKGKAIPYSQGFCCKCTEETGKHVRGGQDCSLANTPNEDIDLDKYKASAHCLHYGKVWYTVNALERPVIEHTVFVQVYNRQEMLNGSTTWVDLTDGEEFTVGTQSPYQFDENKTIVITYVTEKPGNGTVTIPFAERRLLVPQPSPGADTAELHTAVKNGASDYILLSKEKIDSNGDVCNKAGVSYEAFSNQENRCKAKKDTCLDNQPLDFWLEDDNKRKSGGQGAHLLQFFGTPYKEPILVNETTREHWLVLEYYKRHLYNVTVEVNAEKIIAVRSGIYAQIASVVTVSSEATILFHVTILNAGLVSSNFFVQVVECSYDIPDSEKEGAIIPPQMKHEYKVSTKYGNVEVTDKFTCVVEASSKEDGVVSLRKVFVKPKRRCVCYLHCKCDCLWESLKCEPMDEKLYHLAGFRGSLPVLTAKPPYKSWIQRHPLLATFAFLLLLLLFGSIKAGLGFLGYTVIEDMGLDPCLHRAVKIPRYYDPELAEVDVMYDDEGYPVHPDSRERAEVINPKWKLLLNTTFFFVWPCILIKGRIAMHKKEKALNQDDDDEDKVTGDPIEDSIVMETFRDSTVQANKESPSDDDIKRLHMQGEIRRRQSLQGKISRAQNRQNAVEQGRKLSEDKTSVTPNVETGASAITRSQSAETGITAPQSVESVGGRQSGEVSASQSLHKQTTGIKPKPSRGGLGQKRVKKPEPEPIPQLPESVKKFQGASKKIQNII